ncbi:MULTISPECIES: aminoglycoside 3'-phosphotransferase [Kitasatospora]|uniref:aminoglycoside 3'-phosphotransferase n=1 Tax=Kitasatospora TaxID=2063 RepID=UPI001E36E849|nr:aminoglycoside 3'-phosphotransferase [Kitasatospora setae]
MDDALRRRRQRSGRRYGTVAAAAVLGLACWDPRDGRIGWGFNAGLLAGPVAAGLLWAAYLLGPGRRAGLRVGGWTFGAGAPLRSSRRVHGGWQLRRFPLPLVRPLGVSREAPADGRGLLPGLSAYCAVVLLGAGLLALTGGDFGRAAAMVCLLAAAGHVVLLLGHQATPAAAAPAPALLEVTEAVQRDVAEARRLLDALPPGLDSRDVRMAVLIAEGRYRETAELAAEVAAAGDGTAVLVHARALAYLDETGAADDADRAAFHARYAAARRLPRAHRTGSDLEALRELALGQGGLAIDEARSAAAVGSFPLRCGMAYATLALALHRAGRPEEARAALAAAREAGPATARLEFLTGLIGAPGDGLSVQPAASAAQARTSARAASSRACSAASSIGSAARRARAAARWCAASGGRSRSSGTSRAGPGGAARRHGVQAVQQVGEHPPGRLRGELPGGDGPRRPENRVPAEPRPRDNGGMIAHAPEGDTEIPAAVVELAVGEPIAAVWRNELKGVTFRLGDGPGRRFAKWAPAGSGVDLAVEAERTRWARPFTAVPEVLGLGGDEHGSWLLTAGLPGRSAVEPELRADPETAVRAIGEGLRALHEALPVADCPYEWSTAERVARAAELRRPPEEWYPALRHHGTVERALAVLADPPPVDRAVVCHGDPCAPNTLVGDDGRPSGHVDLGALGVADRWADLAVASWSTVWNYGPGWELPLLAAYGVEPDAERLDYYRLLWDLS